MWSLEQIWNDVLIGMERPRKPRDYIYSSEIGKSYWDRYQKMMGVEYTNPYDDRVLRKFSAGNFFEDLIGIVLKKIGILVEEQTKIEIPATKDMLRVSGRMDFLAGGVTNWNDARKRVKESEFPTAVEGIAMNLIDYFEKKYPKGLEKKLLEIKSVNSQVFWAKKDYLEEAYPHHVFQLYSYMRQLGYKEGTIVYISKDDLTIKEIEVKATPELEKKFLEDIKTMSGYYISKTEPPLPQRVVYDARKKLRFSAKKKLEHLGTEHELNKIAVKNGLGEIGANYKIVVVGCNTCNWEVDWSPYRNLITGTKNDEEYKQYERETNAIASDRNDEVKDEFINKLTKLI